MKNFCLYLVIFALATGCFKKAPNFCITEEDVSLDYSGALPFKNVEVKLFTGLIRDLKCGEAIANGYISTTILEYDLKFRHDVLDYLYYEDIKSEKDLAKIGLSWKNISPYLGISSGNSEFNYEKIEDWRTTYKAVNERHIQNDERLRYFQSRADQEQLKIWLQCKMLEVSQGAEGGIKGELIPINNDYAELVVYFLPIVYGGANITEAVLNQDILIRGGRPTCNGYSDFLKGSSIKGATKSLLIKRDKNKLLRVELSFDEDFDDHTFYLNPVASPTLNYFAFDNPNFYENDSNAVIWASTNMTDLKLNGKSVEGSGKSKFKISKENQFTLTIKDENGTSKDTVISLTGIPKPPTVTEVRVYLGSPGWGDGKDYSSVVVANVTITDKNGKTYSANGEIRDLAIPPGFATNMKLNLMGKDFQDLFLADISSIDLELTGYKPDKTLFNSDFWQFRTEVVVFGTGANNLVATGYSNPVLPFNFSNDPRRIYIWKYTNFPFYSQITLTEPIG